MRIKYFYFVQSFIFQSAANILHKFQVSKRLKGVIFA